MAGLCGLWPSCSSGAVVPGAWCGRSRLWCHLVVVLERNLYVMPEPVIVCTIGFKG